MTSSTRAFLESLGYEIRFHVSAWTECLIIGDGETFHGRGADEAAAFSSALSQALPSRLSRRVFDRAGLGVSVSSEGDRDVEAAAVPPAPAPASSADGAVGPVAVIVSRPRGGSSFVPPERAVEARSVSDPEEALEELDILMDRIRDSREELGLCAPDRQRLAMLAWICLARSHTDAFSEDLRIRDRVSQISRLLTEVGKTFWPGSVTALQLHMQPRDLPRHLLGGVATTWRRAAELAEHALRSKEHEDERRNYDHLGWADARQTFPRPADAAALVTGLTAEVEQVSGSLDLQAAPPEANARPDSAQFQRWVRTLRWLRGSEVDPNRWARLAGRFRWWAFRREPSLHPASRELEPGYVPAYPWATLLGQEPEVPGAAREAAEPEPSVESVGSDGRVPGVLPSALIDRVRSVTAGKRSVFVGNRRDPDLQARLQEAFAFESLDCKIAEPRRVQQLGEAIEAGTYDIVLGATGFQSHALDNTLARACRSAGVHYVRVNHGRPLACLRAVARDFGR